MSKYLGIILGITRASPSYGKCYEILLFPYWFLPLGLAQLRTDFSESQSSEKCSWEIPESTWKFVIRSGMNALRSGCEYTSYI